jgi:hypothetical protein
MSRRRLLLGAAAADATAQAERSDDDSDRSAGAQNVLKVAKTQQADGSISVTRTDIYNGGKLVWVPFTKLDTVKGRRTAK